MRWPDLREEPALLLPLGAYVALSSFLGLTGGNMLPSGAIPGVLEFVVGIWKASLAADVVFVVGTVLAGLLALGLAREGNAVGSAAAGLGGNALVYVASYTVLSTTSTVPAADGTLISPWMVHFVLMWGWVGLAFAALAPLAWVRWVETPDASPEDDRATGT